MTEQPFEKRRAGLLAPVFAMRHADDLGTGDTRAVKEAVDFCAETGFKLLQLLPIHETFGNNTSASATNEQSISRALAPAFIYIDPEIIPGLSAEDMDLAAPPAWREEPGLES